MKQELSPRIFVSALLVAVGILALIAWRMFNSAPATPGLGEEVKAAVAMKRQMQQTGQAMPPPGAAGLPTGLPSNRAAPAPQ